MSEEEPNCGERICSFVLRFFASFIMFCCALAIQCTFFYYYALKFIPEKLEEDSENARKYYGLCALFSFFDFMSIWSLLKAFVSNPGYVSDYFKSV